MARYPQEKSWRVYGVDWQIVSVDYLPVFLVYPPPTLVSPTLLRSSYYRVTTAVPPKNPYLFHNQALVVLYTKYLVVLYSIDLVTLAFCLIFNSGYRGPTYPVFIKSFPSHFRIPGNFRTKSQKSSNSIKNSIASTTNQITSSLPFKIRLSNCKITQ